MACLVFVYINNFIKSDKITQTNIFCR